MNVTINDISETRKDVVVTISGDEVAQEESRILKSFIKQAKVPGFRPGKAPLHLLRSRYKKALQEELGRKVAARAYRQNLKRMMDLFRAALRTDDLPVVLGRIVDSGRDDDGLLMDYSPVVQAAQADYAAGDRCAALVDISAGIGWSDDWHYDSASYLRLGAAFAEAMHSLRADCP